MLCNKLYDKSTTSRKSTAFQHAVTQCFAQLVVRLVVKEIHNKSKKWSLGNTRHVGRCRYMIRFGDR